MSDVMQGEFVLGVDLDGVVADFYEGLRPIVAEWMGLEAHQLSDTYSFGLTEWGIDGEEDYLRVHRFAVVERNLFAELQPIPGAPATLRRLSKLGIRIRIITHRLFVKHTHETSINQTVAWLDYFGVPYWDLCFMKEKGAVGAALYIEDSPSNVEALRAAGHETIVFSNPTNSDLEGPRAGTWEEVEVLVSERFDTWRNTTQ